MKDKHLLEAWEKYVATNDMSSFGRIYDVLYGDTFYFAISECQDAHFEAEDIVDEVWEKLLVKKPHIERNIRAYIFTMIKNAIIDLHRKNNRIVSNKIPEGVFSESITSVFLQADEAKEHDLEIRRCLNEKEYHFIMQFADLLLDEHDRQQAHKLLAEASGKALQTVNNTRTSIMKKLKACRANRSN